MTEAEAWEAGRGMWRMNVDKAARQRFAIIVGEGVIRAVGKVTDVSTHDDRASEARRLPAVLLRMRRTHRPRLSARLRRPRHSATRPRLFPRLPVDVRPVGRYTL